MNNRRISCAAARGNRASARVLSPLTPAVLACAARGRGPQRRHPRALGAIVAIAAACVWTFACGLLAQDVMPPGGYKAADPAEHEREKLIDASRVHVARVKYGGGGDWYCDESSLPNLQREFEARTGIPTAKNEIVVELGDPGLSAHPFLYMTGHGNVRLTTDEIEKLRAYLLAGGFLWADDCYGMDASFRQIVKELFPERELALLPLDYPVYRSFYSLEGPPKIHEHDGKPPQGYGVLDGERLMIFYTYETDIGCGLEDADVHNDPPEKREQAIRMGVNILYYALTRE